VSPDRVTGKGDWTQKAGPLEGVEIDTDTLEVEFLTEAGWDPETCVPTQEKLAELGLQDLVPVLHR
jgi:aldehyde:ferredoxin oxidoreductase